jgi:predicted MFS family arabinose efflux permease
VPFGVAQAFSQPAYTGLVREVAGEQRLQSANGFLYTSSSAAAVAGPPLAGALMALHGTGAAFVFDAATFAVSVACLRLLRLPRATGTAARRAFVGELAEGWTEVASRRWLWMGMGWIGSFLLLVIGPFQILGPVVARNSLGGAQAWVAIVSAFAAGTFCGGLVATRWDPRHPLFTAALIIPLEAIAIAMLALRAPLPLIVGSQFLGGLAIGLFLTTWNTVLQRHIPLDRLSRVSAYGWLVVSASLPVGYILVGLVAGALGVSGVLWASVAWVLVSTVIVMLVGDARNLERAPASAGVEAQPATGSRP